MPSKKVGKYEIGRTLGEGTFGKVKFARDTRSGKGVAIKILDKESIQQQNMGAQIKKEISIMKMIVKDPRRSAPCLALRCVVLPCAALRRVASPCRFASLVLTSPWAPGNCWD